MLELVLTNMGDPTGAARTVSPWCVAGRLGLPTQTSGPNEAMFGGSLGFHPGLGGCGHGGAGGSPGGHRLGGLFVV